MGHLQQLAELVLVPKFPLHPPPQNNSLKGFPQFKTERSLKGGADDMEVQDKRGYRVRLYTRYC